MSARLPSREIKQARPLDSGTMQRQAVRKSNQGTGGEGVSLVADGPGRRKMEQRPWDLGMGYSQRLSLTKERCSHFLKAMADLILPVALNGSHHSLLQLCVCGICAL